MTITIKTGVPGSGKTQSMVAELLAFAKKARSKEGTFRPIYTNIDGLDQNAIPHTRLANMPPASEPFVRVPGVLYTIDWMTLPPEAIVVIDEAQDHGFDAMATQAKIPEHVRLLAQHRKDYSVDLWFICQHPKQLHARLRVLCARHQHYERKFGMRSAFCYEWPACQDNFTGKKLAVISRFAFDKEAQQAYASSQVHTKVKYKLPLWVYLPLILIPFAAYVLPQTFSVMTSIMSGKGVPSKQSPGPQSAASAAPGTRVTVTTAPSPPGSVIVPPAPVEAIVAKSDLKATFMQASTYGCILVGPRCACFDKAGLKVDTDKAVCDDLAVRPPGIDLGGGNVTLAQRKRESQGDLDALQFIANNRRPLPDRQMTFDVRVANSVNPD